MKKILLIYGLIILLVFESSGQNHSMNFQSDYTFKIEFFPSFIASCRVEIQREGNNHVLSIRQLFEGNNPRFKAIENDKIESKHRLLIDSTYLKYYGDTIYVRELEQVRISADAFRAFLENLTIDLQEQKDLVKDGILDGITIYANYRTSDSENNFSLRCPDPTDIEFVIIESLFELFESSFVKQETKNYIEDLKGYFDFGLLVKHISNDPLEYRFYGHLSANEVDEFYAWMDALPINKPIILDFSNFGGMGTMFYSDFEDLIEENEDVFWLVSEHSIRQINEIGIKKSRIFKAREALNNAIVE